MQICSDGYFKKLGCISSFFLCLFIQVHAQYYRPIQFKKDAALLTSSGLVFAAGFYIQTRVEPLAASQINSLDKNKIHAFDRIACNYWSPGAARMSDGLAIGSVLLPMIFLANKQTKKEFIPIAHVTIQSLALSQALANISKLSKRTRPFVYNPDAPIEKKLKPDARMSFFSAHTVTVSSTFFSFALAHKTYFKDSKANPYLMASAFVVPAIQAYLRVRAGKHFPSDVIVGYLVGMGSAYLMHRLYLQK